MEAELDITRCATMQRWAQLNSRQISTRMAKAPALTPTRAVSLQHTAGRLIPHALREANLKSSDRCEIYLTVQAAILTTNLCCTVLILHHARASQRPRKLNLCQAYSALPRNT